MTLMTGFLIGLSIVRDKELGTNRAIRVSPVTRTEYFMAKCAFPILVMAAYAVIGPAVLGLLSVSIAKVYLLIVASFAIVLLFGSVIGAFAKNETEAIGLVKSLGMFVILGVLGGFLLPENWQWIVYWLPYYWLYDSLEGVLTLTAEWSSVLARAGISVGICLVVFLGLQKRIRAGLS
jgi:ABC-type multidrug transport system permease subunit